MQISKFINFCMLYVKVLQNNSFMPYYFHFVYVTIKGKGWTGPQCSRRLRLPELLDNQHMKVVRLSALRTGHLHSQETYRYSSLLEAESNSGPQSVRQDWSIKNPNYPIRNRTRGLPACSAVLQLTATPKFEHFYQCCFVSYTFRTHEFGGSHSGITEVSSLLI